MEEEKELERALRREKRSSGNRRWGCLDEAQVAAFADNRLEGEERARVEKHLADCDFCLEQVAFLARIQEAQSLIELPEGLLARARELAERKPGFWLRPAWQWGTAAAATAGLVLVVTLSLRQPEPNGGVITQPVAPTAKTPAPAVLEPQSDPRAVRSGKRPVELPELLWPQDAAMLERNKVEFRWREVRRSLYYEVRLVTAEGNLLWEARLEENHVQPPAEIPLVPGEKYFVWVVAHLPEGRTVKSKAVSFGVKGRN